MRKDFLKTDARNAPVHPRSHSRERAVHTDDPFFHHDDDVVAEKGFYDE